VGNFNIEPKKAALTINLRKLPCPLSSVSSCKIVSPDKPVNLNTGRLTEGEDIDLPPDGAVLVHIK
jgi:hypothetical protein